MGDRRGPDLPAGPPGDESHWTELPSRDMPSWVLDQVLTRVPCRSCPAASRWLFWDDLDLNTLLCGQPWRVWFRLRGSGCWWVGPRPRILEVGHGPEDSCLS